ncbi:MAG: ABC transporter ATP-binding protein, partial [Candidatus Wallbacteria bacterium]|nr:ABC transporter ATP-binding protein [Candidatus Wallbacteria bacterium]
MNAYTRRLLSYGKPYFGKAFASSLMAIFVAGGNAAPAYLLKVLVDEVLPSGSGSKKLVGFTLAILGIMFVKGVFQFGQIFLAAFVSNGMIKDLRKDIFDRLIRYNMGFYYRHQLGQVMARFTSDALLLQGIIQSLVSVVSDTLTIIMLLGYIFFVNSRLAVISLVVIPPVIFVITRFSRKIRRLSYQQQDKVGDISAYLQESFSAMKEIKAFVLEENRSKGFDKINEETFVICLKNNRVIASVLPVVEMFNSMAICFVIMYGGYMTVRGEMTGGDLFSFLAALGILFTPIKRLTTVNNYLQQAEGAARRIYEFLDDASFRECDNQGIVDYHHVSGAVDFREVSFSYDGRKEVLKKISFEIQPGEVV